MGIQNDSGRSLKGHSGDKYSNESPKKDYQDFRQDFTKSQEETARKISRDITEGKLKPTRLGKSIEVRKQELISHIQNFNDSFSNAEKKAWMNRKDELVRSLEG